MRDEKKIRRWMLDEDVDLNVNKIADDPAVKKHYTVVSHTLAGRRHDRKVLAFLVAKGCPVKYLDLPNDMKEAA